MQTILISIIVAMSLSMSKIDLGNEDKSWFALNDGVMGGLSNGSVTYSEDALVFRGNLSFDNNGGFASIRSPYSDWDLTEYKTIEIKYRSKGQEFGFILEKERAYYQPYYKFILPIAEEWTVLKMPLSDFQAQRLGKNLNYTLSDETKAEIIRLGIITNQKTIEEFSLEIDQISFK